MNGLDGFRKKSYWSTGPENSNRGNSSIADSEDEKLAVTLRRIMAKEFVSIKETALLLNCSDGHIRNLVGKAQKGKASHPIPFLDLDGVTVFPRVKLLEWAKQPKKKLRAVR